MEKYLTIKEAAKVLRVTPQTLRNWDKKGKLVAWRNPINRYRVYKASQIEEFFEDMEEERRKERTFRIKIKQI